jgi:2-phospho-L-lactate guanylyltransferase
MKVVAVVPVRAPGEGKSRLAGILSPRRRADLVRGMLARVLAALTAARRMDEVWVVTPDETLELPPGVRTIHDHGTGLNTRYSSRRSGSPAGRTPCCWWPPMPRR